MAWPTYIQNFPEYDLTNFDLRYALSGGVLFAKDTSYIADTYYIAVTDFGPSADKNLPYQAKVDGKEMLFSEDGVSSLGTYILECANYYFNPTDTTTRPTGAVPGDVHTVGTGGNTQYFITDTLNFRETVATHVLNALIGKTTVNPIDLNLTMIKQLVEKAFLFSMEFTNQALSLRASNAEQQAVEGGGTVIVPTESAAASSTTDLILSDISRKLQTLNAKLETTFTVIPDEEEEEIRVTMNLAEAIRSGNVNLVDGDNGINAVITRLTNIKNAINGSSGSVTASLNGTGGIAGTLANLHSDIYSDTNSLKNTLSTTNTRLSTMSTNLSAIEAAIIGGDA